MELQQWTGWWEETGSLELRGILLTEWDPLLVGDAPQAQDEYDAYLAPLGSALRAGAGRQAVVDYLVDCEQRMGFKPSAAQLEGIAGQIVSWYESTTGAQGAAS
jgi:hypothetical protein